MGKMSTGQRSCVVWVGVGVWKSVFVHEFKVREGGRGLLRRPCLYCCTIKGSKLRPRRGCKQEDTRKRKKRARAREKQGKEGARTDFPSLSSTRPILSFADLKKPYGLALYKSCNTKFDANVANPQTLPFIRLE